MAERKQAELVIILEYLPHQMSEEEILAIARQVIEEVGAQVSCPN
ncbi:GatB/YqeY domain-containing protein [Dehalococcoidia bacterium]|nr:GatB/YqeY domain-containing protein [Dehalococcoidia bacterium]